MAANLAKAGVPLVVYDASPTAAAAAGKHAGVRVVASPGEVAAHVSVLFTCLPNDAIVRAVYLAPGGIAAGGRPGLITCDCSTVSPEATLEVAAGVKARGIVHMDTPMLGSQPQAVSGEIFFIVGGERSKLEAIKPYLDIMGRLHMYVGLSASGNRVKLAHNGLAAVISVAVAEALATVRAVGGRSERLLRGGPQRRRHGVRDVLRSPGEADARRRLLADVRRRAHAEGRGLALDLARTAKVPTPMLEETKQTYGEAVAGGWGKDDFSAVTHVIEKRIGRRLSNNPPT